MDAPYEFINAVFSHDVSYGNKPSPAVLQINRGSPMVNKMEDFKLCVQRLTFPTLTIPQYAAQLQVGTNYTDNQMVYNFSISIVIAGVETFSDIFPVTFVTNSTITQPTGVVTKSLQSDNPFYYNDIQGVLSMFNTTLSQALTNLKTKVPVLNLPANTLPPVFYINSGVMTLLVPAIYISDGGRVAGYLKIYFNNQTTSLMNGFCVAQGPGAGRDLYFRIVTNNLSLGTITYNSNPYYQFTPQSYSYSFWSPCSKILITTTIGVNSESIPGYNSNYGLIENNAVTTSTNLSPQSLVLTDFSPDWSVLQNYSTVFVYNKTDSTRFSSIVANGALNSFGMNLFWVDNAGLNIPLYLMPLSTSTIKIEFIKIK